MTALRRVLVELLLIQDNAQITEHDIDDSIRKLDSNRRPRSPPQQTGSTHSTTATCAKNSDGLDADSDCPATDTPVSSLDTHTYTPARTTSSTPLPTIEELVLEQENAGRERAQGEEQKVQTILQVPYETQDIDDTVQGLNYTKVESSEEYPNGDIEFRRSAIDAQLPPLDYRSVGWAMLVYKEKTNQYMHRLIYKSCLGNFECPKSYCQYHVRPRLPESRRKGAEPKPPASNTCRFHTCELRHIPCHAILKLTHTSDETILLHSGVHNHKRPHPIRPTAVAKIQFNNIVKIGTEVTPKALQLGTSTRDPVTKLHPTYTNLDRTAYHRKKLLKGTNSLGGLSSAIGMIADFERTIGVRIMESSSFADHDGHIALQTSHQRYRLLERSSPLQTDSIEGFVTDGFRPDVNLCVTSGFDPVIRRTIPLLASILFGKSATHYKAHFRILFRTMDMSTNIEEWYEGDRAFVGNTSDFSDAERRGFDLAVHAHCSIDEDIPIDLERLYRCCQVHFKRTLARICHNAAIVPPAKSKAFSTAVLYLLTVDDEHEFERCVRKLSMGYPSARSWINWHIARSRFIFPATTKFDLSHMSADTNAQESLGGDIQRLAQQKKLTIGLTLEHVHRYNVLIEDDYRAASAGMDLRYATRPTKRRQPNDGRPPDTTQSVMKKLKTQYPLTKKPKIGRPKGSRNVVPKIDITCHGIPWGISSSNPRFKASNTCALDSALMMFFLIRKYNQLQYTYHDPILENIYNLLDNREFDTARIEWATTKLGMALNAEHDMWGAIDELFVNHAKTIFSHSVAFTVSCDNPICAGFQLSKRNKQWSSIYLEANVRSINTTTVQAALQEHQTICTRTDNAMSTVCKGIRQRSYTTVNDSPMLLDIPIVVDSSKADIDYDHAIEFANYNYFLAAVFYTTNNHTHFTASALVQGKALYYDGIPQVHLKWYAKPEKRADRPVCRLWYQRANKVTPELDMLDNLPPPITELFEQLQSLRRQTQSPHPPSPQLQSQHSPIPPSPQPQSQHTPISPSPQPQSPQQQTKAIDFQAIARQANLARANGLTPEHRYQEIQPQEPVRADRLNIDNIFSRLQDMLGRDRVRKDIVAKMGKKPVCQSCYKVIERGHERLITKDVVNKAKNWYRAKSYHWEVSCVRLAHNE